jgi:hypothetical protein
MDSKLLLVKLVTLLYKEAELKTNGNNSAALARQLLSTIKLPETSFELTAGVETLSALNATVNWMLESRPETGYDRANLLQRIRVNVGDEVSLFEAVEQGTVPVTDEAELKRQAVELRMELKNYLTQWQIKAVVKKAYQRTYGAPGKIDFRDIVREVMRDLEGLEAPDTETKVRGVVEEVDFADQAKMTDMLRRAAEETSTEGILRTGWQALNRMTGIHGGFRRGEMIVIPALQHNFKTGMATSLFTHIPMFNTPYMRDPLKKPAVMLLSTENDLQINVYWIYSHLKELETGVPFDAKYFRHEDDEVMRQRNAEAVAYIHERLSANGYVVLMKRIDPTTTTYDSLTEIIDQAELDGLELHLLVIDYLPMISRKGLENTGPTGSDIRDLYRRLRAYTSIRGITTVTPHQLSTEAKMLKRAGVNDFLAEVVNKGYYDGCRTVDQEVDLELYIDIVIVNGRKYLHFARGKHRRIGPVLPESELSFYIPFQAAGSIPPDINGSDTSCRRPGGGPPGSGSETPWWEGQAPAGDPAAP